MEDKSNTENKDINNKNEDFMNLLNEHYDTEVKKVLAEKLEKNHGVLRNKLVRPRRKVIRILTSIAATLVALFMMNTFINPFGSNLAELADEMLLSTPLTLRSDISTRGQGNDLKQNDAIQLALESKNYNEAIRLYGMQGPIDALSLSDRFYYGVSLIKAENGNLENAIELLSEISNNKNAFQLDARWFLSLAYIKNNEFQKGEEQLLILIEKSNYQKKNAKKLLNKITS